MIRCSATGTLPGRALGVGRPRGRDFNATSGIAISGLCRNSTNRKRRQIPLDAQSSAGYQSTKCYTIVMMLYIQGTSSPSLVAERPPHLLATSVLMLARSGAAGLSPTPNRARIFLPPYPSSHNARKHKGGFGYWQPRTAPTITHVRASFFSVQVRQNARKWAKRRQPDADRRMVLSCSNPKCKPACPRLGPFALSQLNPLGFAAGNRLILLM